MCGITGVVDYSGKEIQEARISRASDLINHRGPDSDGIFISGACALAHKRLSVIDLSPTGHQPMLSANQRYSCVFNGEIYNFQDIRDELVRTGTVLRGSSDTEVLLEAWVKWGVASLERFDGMFAFAIWDNATETLFAARDRMGEKPFYYHHGEKLFSFSSRPTPLFELVPSLSREYDEQSIRYFLESGYVPAPGSIYRAISKLPAAHYLTYSRDGLRINRYWNPNDIATDRSYENRSENDVLDELDTLINKSIKQRMLSDVPIGSFLSGGIDSGLMTAVMSKHSKGTVSTFTIGFDEEAYDESHHARAVADHLGTNHHCENLKVNDLLALFPDFLKQYDEPFFDSAAFPTMAVSRLARKHVTVALTGDGGDELFGGYHYYQIIKYLSYIANLPSGSVKLISWLLKKLPVHNLKLVSAALQEESIAAAFGFSRSIAKDFQNILSNELLNRTKGLRQLFQDSAQSLHSSLHASEVSMRLDCLFTLNDDYLQKTDVASMAYSLESRAPLLSRDVIEYAMTLPIQFKINGGTSKYLLRKLAYRYIPQDIMDRPKRGFGVPIDNWLRNELSEWAGDRINDPENFKNLPLRQDAVKSLLRLHQSGSRNVHPLLWAVLVFLEFHTRNES